MVSKKKQIKEQLLLELKEIFGYIKKQEEYLNKYNLPKDDKEFLTTTIEFWNKEAKKLENNIDLIKD